MISRIINKAKIVFAFGLVLSILLTPLHGLAATTYPATVANPYAFPKITFTFDDGLASTYTQAFPTLKKYGLVGTNYVTTSCIGMTITPNTCRANDSTPYMSWTQVKSLQAAGWEIGSHTVTHPYLATSDATDGQPNVLTPTQVTSELTQSKVALAAQGINATDFAAPYGDYNNAVLAQIAKYYASQRGFADQNNNDWPYNDYLINDYHVEGPTSVAQVKAKIDDAVTNNRWLVLTFHDIKTKPSKNADDYEWSTSFLDQIAAYTQTKQAAGLLKNVNINQGLVTSSTNMFTNGSFNNGISDGWTTNNSSAVTSDSGNNGSYPDPTKSIRLTSPTSGSAYLFSPKVAVNNNTMYVIKNFLNVQSLTSGEVSFYVDEYDVNGNWISGKYLKGERSAFVENMNLIYKPSSAMVATASLQVGVTGTGISAYLDNTQMFAVQTSSPTTPTGTNLVTNGNFDSGVTTGWTTDNSTALLADSANNGSPNNPINSVKIQAGAINSHLFSPKVLVDSTKSYSLTSYLKLLTISSGEVGFYIDEYDVNGNWISGQYKFGVRSVSNGDIALAYKPSSANVKSASLQIIVVGNSSITGYFDDVRWYLN